MTQEEVDNAWHEAKQIAKLQREVDRRTAEWLARYGAAAAAKAGRVTRSGVVSEGLQQGRAR